MFRSIFKNIIKWHHISFLLILLILLTTLSGCASREKLLKEIDQHYTFGLHYLENGDLTKAHEEFERIKNIAPDNDRAYFGLGLTFYFQGKFALALSSYQKAIEAMSAPDSWTHSQL
jgi:Tfp pilus assembly protein PilF